MVGGLSGSPCDPPPSATPSCLERHTVEDGPDKLAVLHPSVPTPLKTLKGARGKSYLVSEVKY